MVDLNQVTVPCKDYAKSVQFYMQLGLRQIVDSPPRYARFETAAGTTFSIHNTESNVVPSEIMVYFEVDDVDAIVVELQKKGVIFELEPTDQDWLWREAHLRDPAGNRLCIYHAGEHRRNPPWRVKGEPVS
jgi:catechol 2,3-dioxygenase-like lactoylglutathione lyase family enzyme